MGFKTILKGLFAEQARATSESNSSYPIDASDRERDIIENVLPFTMTSVERILALINSVRYIAENNIEGALVECGVWKGGSSMAMMQTLQAYGFKERDFYLYDTFDGMSEPTDKDVSCYGEDAKRVLSQHDKSKADSYWCYSPLEEVKNNIKALGYGQHRLNFVEGKVEETLQKLAPEKIALLRLDTDWYESTKVELEVLWPKLVSGGVLIIDDYGHWQGARRAVDEYIANNKLCLLLNRIDYTGRIAIKP